MNDTLKITIVQPDIIWEKPAENRARLDTLLQESGETDLIALPEMFTTGFSMNPSRLYETMDGETIRWMKNKAAGSGAAITGSLIIQDQGKMLNRCIWASPDGSVQWYDKRHLYTMGSESKHYSAGSGRLIVEYKGWRICPLICYDLRFPVWSRNTENYDLLVYVANWPSPRHHVWKNLIVARSVENQAYCAGVNRTGNDGAGNSYSGDSVMSDPKGYATFMGDGELVKTFELSWNELHNFRQKFPLLPDRDQFTIL